MEKREKKLLFATMILLVFLVIKSFWIDPLGSMEGDLEKYRLFSQISAPYRNDGMLQRMNLLTYRVRSVQKKKEGVKIDILYWDEKQGEWKEESLDSNYQARVRAYLFWIFPIKDIKIEGGL